MSLPLVAIVILNYNGRNYLEKFLPSVISGGYDNKKIIVADNASADDSIVLVTHHFPDVEIILLERNYGFAEGYNQALQKIQADYYVLLNSDVEVTKKWIEPIISLMENDKNIAACQPKMLSYHKKESFEYAGAAGGWIDYLGYLFARGRIFEKIEIDKKQYDDIQPVFWASGAAMFVRANVYHQLTGFDTFFFAHQEEVDLCWRMQLAGYKVMYCSSSVVYHVGGGTLPKGHYKKTYFNFRNNLVMLLKNLTATEKLWKLPLRILLDVAFAFKSLFTGDVTTFKAIANAHFSLVNWCFTAKNKHHLIKKPMRRLSGVSTQSVVWAYFVQKKTCFKEIVENKHK